MAQVNLKCNDELYQTHFQEANICYESNSLIVKYLNIPLHNEEYFMLPPRIKHVIFIRVIDTQVTQGYFPLLDASPDVYIGNALVSIKNAIALSTAINATESTIKIITPVLKVINTIRSICSTSIL